MTTTKARSNSPVRASAETGPHVAPGARPEVAAALATVREALRELGAALLEVRKRRAREFEIWSTSKVLADWVEEDDAGLQPFVQAYGKVRAEASDARSRAGLGPAREGLRGILADLTDLSVLNHRVDMASTIVFQGAKELGDKALLAAVAAARNHSERTTRWVRTQIDHVAPEALAVAPNHEKSSARRSTRQPAMAVRRTKGKVARTGPG